MVVVRTPRTQSSPSQPNHVFNKTKLEAEATKGSSLSIYTRSLDKYVQRLVVVNRTLTTGKCTFFFTKDRIGKCTMYSLRMEHRTT
jgi:hypothetical protein